MVIVWGASFGRRLNLSTPRGRRLGEFSEVPLTENFDNIWHRTAVAVVGNCVVRMHQVAQGELRMPFTEGVARDDPLGVHGA